jgi:hypothetical protein
MEEALPPAESPQPILTPPAEPSASPEQAPYRGVWRPADLRTFRRVAPRTTPLSLVGLGGLFALVAAVDATLFRADAGGVAVAGTGVLAALVSYLAATRRRVGGAALVALFAVLALAGSVAYTGSVLAGVLLPVAVFAFARALRGVPLAAAPLIEGLFATLPALPTRMDALFRGVSRLIPRVGAGGGALRIVVPTLAVALFLPLFALANPHVGEALHGIFEALGGLVSGQAVARIVLALCLLIPAIYLAKPTGFSRMRSPHATPSDPLVDGDVAIALNTFRALSALFAAFVVIDVATLASVPAAPGVGAQLRAHAGVTWLVVVLVLVLGVVALLVRPARLAATAADVRRRIVVHTLVFLGLAGAIGLLAVARMGLHLLASGLSDLRIVGAIGIAIVFGALAAIGRRAQGSVDDAVPYTDRWLSGRLADLAAIGLVVYAVLPTHRISATVDAALIARGAAEPLIHLRELGAHDEAIYPISKLLYHHDARVRLIAARAVTRNAATKYAPADATAHADAAALRGALAPRTDALLRGYGGCLDNALLDLTTQINFLGDPAAVAPDPWLWADCRERNDAERAY